MRRADKLLKLIFILTLLISSAHIVFAENNDDGIILRPVIVYNSGDLRNPFSNLFQLSKEKEEQSIQAPKEIIEPQVPMPSLENFKVQGAIWGGKFPQVIINNKMLKIGDLIDDFEIVNIEKKGITLSFNGMIANLNFTGYTPALGKGDKEEK